MPIPYAERRRRRQRLAETLPPELRGRVALRNVEVVSKLPSEAQHTLAKALDTNVRIPVAIQYLKENPQATLDEVVGQCRKSTGSNKQTTKSEKAISPSAQDTAELTALLQDCFPDMPRITAEAMAKSELMSGVLRVVCAQRACLASSQARSDFVLVVLCGLVLKTAEGLNGAIAKGPGYREALLLSGVDWPWLDAVEPLDPSQETKSTIPFPPI